MHTKFIAGCLPVLLPFAFVAWAGEGGLPNRAIGSDSGKNPVTENENENDGNDDDGNDDDRDPRVRIDSVNPDGALSAGISGDNTGLIGGVVFYDLNGNGAFEAGEPGKPGERVTLSSGGSFISTTVTDAGGNYEIPLGEGGRYQLLFGGDITRTIDVADGSIIIDVDLPILVNREGPGRGASDRELNIMKPELLNLENVPRPDPPGPSRGVGDVTPFQP